MSASRIALHLLSESFATIFVVVGMRCFFLRRGHIAGVELLPGLGDAEAVEKCRQMYEAKKDEANYEGFEVWDQARMVIQHSPVAEADDKSAPPNR